MSLPTLKRILQISQVMLLVAVGLGVLAYGLYRYATHRDFPDYVEEGVAARAEAVCRELMPARPRFEPFPPDATFDQRADRVEALAIFVDSVLARVRQVEGADSSSGYQLWLKDWDDSAKAGHGYAIALRTGDSGKYEPAGNKGDEPTTWLARTATYNKMPSCVLA